MKPSLSVKENQFSFKCALFLLPIIIVAEILIYQYGGYSNNSYSSVFINLIAFSCSFFAVLLPLYLAEAINLVFKNRTDILARSIQISFSAIAAAFFISSAAFIIETGYLLDPGIVHYGIFNFSLLSPVYLDSVSQNLSFTLVFVCGSILLSSWYLSSRRILQPSRPISILIFIVGISWLLLVPQTEPGKLYAGAAMNFSNSILSGDNESRVSEFEKLANLSSFEHAQPNNKSPKTIVLIVGESFRNDVWQHSPNIKALRDKGVYFENAYTNVSHSSKALFSIFCGIYPNIWMNYIESSEPYQNSYCLPHWMGQQGYSTVFIQSADASFEDRYGLVTNMGFSDFYGGEDLKEMGAKEIAYFSQDDAFLNNALDHWLSKQADEDRLFISLFNSNTHHPYELADEKCPVLDPRVRFKCYLKTIEYYDQVVGKMIDNITKKRGDDTLFIFVSDHGEGFAEKGSVTQHDAVPYEEVVNVPVIFYHKGMTPKVNKDLWLISDIAYTLLDNYTVRHDRSGQVARNMLNESGHKMISTYCWYRNACMTVRDKQTKWVFHIPFKKYQVFPDIDESKNTELRSVFDDKANKAFEFGTKMQNRVNGFHKHRTKSFHEQNKNNN